MLLFGIVLFIYVIVCVLLCLLILIQSDKGGGISATLGGGFAGANALLGSSDTANILTRGTNIFAALFVGLCILLSVIVSFANNGNAVQKSILKERAEKTPASILDNQSLPMAGENPGAQQQSPGIPLSPPSQQAPIPLGQPAQTPAK